MWEKLFKMPWSHFWLLLCLDFRKYLENLLEYCAADVIFSIQMFTENVLVNQQLVFLRSVDVISHFVHLNFEKCKLGFGWKINCKVKVCNNLIMWSREKKFSVVNKSQKICLDATETGSAWTCSGSSVGFLGGFESNSVIFNRTSETLNRWYLQPEREPGGDESEPSNCRKGLFSSERFWILILTADNQLFLNRFIVCFGSRGAKSQLMRFYFNSEMHQIVYKDEKSALKHLNAGFNFCFELVFRDIVTKSDHTDMFNVN